MLERWQSSDMLIDCLLFSFYYRSNDNKSTNEGDTNQDQPSPPSCPIEEYLAQPVNSLNLALFRTAFGFLMCFLQYRALYWQDITVAYFQYAEINFHFCFARGIPMIPYNQLLNIYAISVFAAFFMGIGFLYRASCATFLVIYTYLNLLEKSRYNNHFYLYILLTFFFLITDAHKRFSVDSILSRLRKTQVAKIDTRIPFWQILIFRFQLFVVYFYAGIAKLNYDWFFRFQPMTIWSMQDQRFSIFGNILKYFFPSETVPFILGVFLSVGGLLFDLFIGLFLITPFLRPIAFAATIFFHLSNHFLFRIGTFPWVMMSTNVLFLHPDTMATFFTKLYQKLHNLITWIFSEPAHLLEQRPSVRMSKPLKAFLITYIVIQLLLPFRHWLYPSNVNWTQEGHQFSWRMMLNDEDVIMRIDVESKKHNYSFK